jgi:hypothetical protein
MINPTGQNNQIPLLQPNPHPIISLAPDIEVARAVQNIPNLLVLMQVLVEEAFYFLLVDVAHGGGGDGDFVAVLVRALLGERFYFVVGGDVLVEDAKVGEVGGGDGAAGVVGEALVALRLLVSRVGGWWGKGEGVFTSMLSNQ